MKLCAPCLKVLERGEGSMCLRCKRSVEALLLGMTEEAGGVPPFWVPNAESLGVFGMSGMGKSTYQKGWSIFLMKRGVPVYWIDLMREASIHGIKRERAPLGPLLTQVTVGELAEDPKYLLEYVAPGAKAPALAIVTNKERPTREERAEDFVRGLNLLVENKPKGDCVVFLAECGLLEGSREAEELLEEAATTYRKEGISLVYDVQSVSMVPNRARRQWKEVVAFKQVDEADHAACRRLMTRRFADAVMDLRPFSALLGDRLDKGPWRGEQEDQEPEEAGADEAA